MLVTIKCSKCGKELTSLERTGEATVYALDPCPTCLCQSYINGANDYDSDWDDDEEYEDDWDEDDDDWEDDWDGEDDDDDATEGD